MAEKFEPLNQRCRDFMGKEGFARLERLARGQGQARKRPDLAILAMRLICEYAFGRPPKQEHLQEIREKQKMNDFIDVLSPLGQGK